MVSIRRARCSRLSRRRSRRIGRSSLKLSAGRDSGALEDSWRLASARAVGAGRSIFDQSGGDCPINFQTQALKPAAELAGLDPVQFPNESAEYRAARTALLAEEIELRRYIARVAAQRCALPPGGPVIGDYRF